MKKTIEELIEALQTVAVPRQSILYEILLRRAGWGVKWFEQSRCTTPIPPIDARRSTMTLPELTEQLRAYSEAVDARTREGSVVYAYYPTLREALESELIRLKALGPPSENGHPATPSLN